MNNNIESIKSRIHILEMRDPIPYNIINKLKRRLRKLEK